MNPALILVAATTLVSFSIVIGRWPKVGLALLGLVAITEWHYPLAPPLFSIFGLRMTVSDVIVAAITLSFLTEFRRIQGTIRLSATKLAGAVFVFFLFLSLALGVLQYGIGAATNEARSWIYIICIACWCTVFLTRRDGDKDFRFFALFTGAAISLVWLINTLQYGFGGASIQVGIRSVWGEEVAVGRAITSGQAMFLAVAALVAFHTYRYQKNNVTLIFAFAFGTIVLLAQHRSVWIALTTMSAFYILTACRNKILILISLSGLTLLSVLIWQTDIGASVTSTLSDSAQDTRTFDGRIYDWVYTLRQLFDAGIARSAVGWEFGHGYERFREDGLLISYIPHNWYVGTVLRVGIVGLAVGVGWMGLSWLSARRRPGHPIIGAILVGILVYAFNYNLQWYLTPMLVMASYYGIYNHKFINQRQSYSYTTINKRQYNDEHLPTDAVEK